ncbi:SPFH domain-containing protein [Teredinibacter sp. KSP-S5-2]|uniref:SPFH domain-containing protein n=1 Tax=Teredinibacter sp. KSP-S5-2 TaxID=3034506 RepID=UPI00293438D3|nr:SPFH domain-containing protein [Teredinibacter sp. KSP-S5-2]WNO10880.1 SPFH domain-containing protein [Teredinibacter sp. KSP-S5-2]
MFGFKYIKSEPTTYLMQFSRGKLKRKGAGLAFWYFSPSVSMVAIPMGSVDQPFMFKESTKDFQEVNVQGQIVFRIVEPEKLASIMNYSLKPGGAGYVSEDPEKLKNRVVSLVQVIMRSRLEQLELREAISASKDLVSGVKSALMTSDVLSALGVEVLDFAILAIKPNPETARALEASVREQLLEEADEAIYKRRNASIDQERLVKENELKTELAVEQKQQIIKEEKLKAERQLAEQRRQMKKEALEAEIEQEEKRKEFVELSTENSRKQADAKAYDISETMQALAGVDVRVLEALVMSNLKPEQMLAQGIRELAGNSEKIGQLNFSPDLLQAMAGAVQR